MEVTLESQDAKFVIVNTKKRTHLKHDEHCLCYIEGVPPVVIGYRTIVLLHRQQPPAQDVVVDVETIDEMHIGEHSNARLQCIIH